MRSSLFAFIFLILGFTNGFGISYNVRYWLETRTYECKEFAKRLVFIFIYRIVLFLKIIYHANGYRICGVLLKYRKFIILEHVKIYIIDSSCPSGTTKLLKSVYRLISTAAITIGVLKTVTKREKWFCWKKRRCIPLGLRRTITAFLNMLSKI
jgi:hypothetical protein